MKKETLKETSNVEVNETKPSYGYYSRVLGQVFDNVEDLLSAERKDKEAKLAENEKARVKKEKAENVEKAYREYVETVDKANQEIANAQSKYLELKDEFIKEYGSFHMTYSNKEKDGKCNRDVRVSDSLGSIFDVFKNFPF